MPVNFQSTAIYENRLADKLELESELKLFEQGDSETEFYIPNGELLFKGYERVVYGDHGPYIEFSLPQLKAQLFSKFGNKIDTDNLPGEDYKYYYFWLLPKFHSEIKIYLQIKTVHNLPNAPRRNDGKPSAFNRLEGYADYKRGYFYVDPFSVQIKTATKLIVAV